MKNNKNHVRFFARTLSIVSVLYLGAFTVGIPAAAQDSGVRIDKSLGQTLARGTQVWSNNCNRCHNVRWADELTDTQWKPVIMHMRIRAGLTGQEARDVLKFYRYAN